MNMDTVGARSFTKPFRYQRQKNYRMREQNPETCSYRYRQYYIPWMEQIRGWQFQFGQNQTDHIDLGKWQYFTNLNISAIKGDDSPYIHHHLWVSVVGWGRGEIYPDVWKMWQREIPWVGESKPWPNLQGLSFDHKKTFNKKNMAIEEDWKITQPSLILPI